MKKPEKQDLSRKINGSVATQFKPGLSGNPGGRRKGPTLYGTIRKILDNEPETREKLARAFLAAALDGSFQHLCALIERESGKITQGIAVDAVATSPERVPFDTAGFGRQLREATTREISDGSKSVPQYHGSFVADPTGDTSGTSRGK